LAHHFLEAFAFERSDHRLAFGVERLDFFDCNRARRHVHEHELVGEMDLAV
jgi:hypothetical protein